MTQALDPIYVSIDVEANGPIPGPYSMLSIGAAAFKYPDPTPVSVHTANLFCLPGAEIMEPSTAEFWRKHEKEYAATQEGRVMPIEAMRAFNRWLCTLAPQTNQLACVAWPLGFDWGFVNWYLIRFVGRNAMGLSGIDLRTMAWAVRGGEFRGTNKKSLPKEWFPRSAPHTHVAVEDAIEQGGLFIRVLDEARALQRGV